ncbi:hypothetical protein IHE33_02950 [Mycetohabitans endofungorum]
MVSKKRKLLYQRFFLGFACLLAIPLMVLMVSLAKGAGWKPLVPGLPIYLTLLGGAIYQLVKELRAMRREEQEAGGSEKTTNDKNDEQ